MPTPAPRRRVPSRRTAHVAVLLALLSLAADPAPNPPGDFPDRRDVGVVSTPGSADYDPAKRQYTVTAAGENIWGRSDAFHFLSRPHAGDLTFSAAVRFVGPGKDPHRKACLMVRQSLDPDAPYADVAVHGDGLVSLQFRREKAGATEEVQARAKVKGPVSVRLRREGHVFTVVLAPAGMPPQEVGSVTLALEDPVRVGLAVSAHDASGTETAIFSSVTVAP